MGRRTKTNEDVKCIGCQTVIDAAEKSKAGKGLFKREDQKRLPVQVTLEQTPGGGGGLTCGNVAEGLPRGARPWVASADQGAARRPEVCPVQVSSAQSSSPSLVPEF